MTISFDSVARKVFQVLKSRGYALKMFKENGEKAFDPETEARKFFIEEEGIMVAIDRNGDDSEIKVFINEETSLKDIESMLHSLRQTANFYGLLYNVRKYGKKLKPKEFAFLAYRAQRKEEEDMTESVSGFKNIAKVIDALLLRELTPKQVHEELKKFDFSGMNGPLKFQVEEYIQEGYRNLAEAKDTSNLWGTSQSSYQRIGSKQARLVVRHSQPVDEDKFAARSRHISKIFIENADGERIKFPVTFLQGARAMTRHVSMGGNFNDDIGQHIQSISEEYDILKTFKKNAGRKLHEHASNVIGLVRNRSKEIIAEVKGMQGPKSYKRYVENFEPKDQALEEDTAKIVMLEVEHIKKLFNSVTQYEGLDEAFIVVARLSRMNEDFAAIAEMIEAGDLSFSPKREMRAPTYTNRSSTMLEKLRDLAERASDSRVSGFISRVSEKITNEIPMERAELDLVKGIVGIAEGSATAEIEALDEFVDWADHYIIETSQYLDKKKRSEKEAGNDVAKSRKEWADAEARQPGKKKKVKEETDEDGEWVKPWEKDDKDDDKDDEVDESIEEVHETELDEDIIRFQELAGIQKKR